MRRSYPRHRITIDPRMFALAAKMILSRKVFSGGESVAKFEAMFADYVGVKHAIGVGSARSGLYLGLKSLHFDNDDEIIMPSYTFYALPLAVMMCGLRPIFVDVDSGTYNIDPSLIREKVNDKTRAILVTHMFGQPCDMDPIIKIADVFNLIIIEDCAHALGATYKGKRVGSLGDLAIFSFGKGKNLPCFGGGMITLKSDKICANIRRLIDDSSYPTKGNLIKEVISTFAFYCLTQRRIFSHITYPLIHFLDFIGRDCVDRQISENMSQEGSRDVFLRKAKMVNLQAAAGMEQFASLDLMNRKRRSNAQLLIEQLKKIQNVSFQMSTPWTESTYLYFYIRVLNRENFRKSMLLQRIDTKQADMHCCSNLKAFERYKASCPVAERLSLESIEIPNNPFLEKDDILYIAERIKNTVPTERLEEPIHSCIPHALE